MKVYRVELKASAVIFKHAKSKDGVPVVEKIVRMGPYQGTSDLPANCCRWLNDHGLTVNPCFEFNESRHPDPFGDILLKRNIQKEYAMDGFADFELKNHVLCNFLYGFDSLKMLDAWFDEGIRAILHRSGYGVMVYEAKEVYVGSKQAVFEPNTAELVDMLQMTEIPAFEENYNDPDD